ncbi:hypothetical protein [Streptomyces canus]|uniref:hypothetical protein n=1 Tax=Streptomyces canus TaxID=58343 RepID=UPI0036EDE3E0
MENAELRELLANAVQEGVVPQELVDQIGEESDIEEGRVATANLVDVYSRRLNRVAGNEDLREATYQLVEFLNRYPAEELNMVSVRPCPGGFHLFLADAQSLRILFWMRMFSR